MNNMRRMKFRAVPNIGIGGNAQRVNLPRNKPPDTDVVAVPPSATEPVEKAGIHGMDSFSGKTTTSTSTDNGPGFIEEKEKKNPIMVDLVEKSPSCSESNQTFNSRGNQYESQDCDKEVCSDIKLVSKVNSKKESETLCNVSDEIQEIPTTESIQCLGTYKALQSPLMQSSKEPSTLCVQNVNPLDSQDKLLDPSKGKKDPLIFDITEDSQSKSRKSNATNPKPSTESSIPESDVECITEADKVFSSNIDISNKELIIDDEKVVDVEDGKKNTLQSDDLFVDEVKVSSVTISTQKKALAPPMALTRRPKIRAKPSLFSNVGKKTSGLCKKDVNVSVTPTVVTVEPQAEVILDDDDNGNSSRIQMENAFCAPLSGSSKRIEKGVPPVEDEKETKNLDSSEVEKTQEIIPVLDDTNDTRTGDSAEVSLAGIEENTKIHKVVDSFCLGEEMQNVLDVTAQTKTGGKEMGLSVGGKDNIESHCDNSSGDSVLEKEEKLMPFAQVANEKSSSPKAVGPSIRRRKINAKPSILNTGGRREKVVLEPPTIAGVKYEPVQDKEATLLSGDGNDTIKTENVKEKMENEVEKEIHVNYGKEIILEEPTCSSVLMKNEVDIPNSGEVKKSVFPVKLPQLASSGSVTPVSSEIVSHGTIEKPITAAIAGNVQSKPSISSSSNVRRSRIHAKPSFTSKRKPLQIEAQDLVKISKDKEGAEDIINQNQVQLLSEKVKEEKGKVKNDSTSEYCQTLAEEKKCKEASGSEECVKSSSVSVKKRHFEDDNFGTLLRKGNQHNRKKLDVHELSNSDDSGGNKENSSRPKCSNGGKALKRERSSKESNKVPVYSKRKSKLFQLDSQKKKFPVKSEIKLDVSDGESDSEESKQKRIFRERKEKFRKKFSQSQGNIERGQMTMFDLIFWNPISNPMPGRTDTNRKKDSSVSVGDVDGLTADILEEQMVDEIGLDNKSAADESTLNSPDSGNGSVEVCSDESLSQKSNEQSVEKCENLDDKKENDNNDDTVHDVFAPRVKIGPNGQIILDEQSIKIQTTAAKNRDEILSKAEVVEESNDSAHYGKWNKKRRRSCEWTMKETARFYKALSTVGTDFSLMETLFTWRSRAELKTKFKKEERTNRELVDRALKDCTQFDFTPFDEESDYDPEEDRKASRIAERAEAKRKRLEMKQSQREEEKLRKKMLMKETRKQTRERKAVIRKMRNQFKPKKKAKEAPETDPLSDGTDDFIDRSDSDVEFEPPVKSVHKKIDQAPSTDLPRKKRVLKKKRQASRKLPNTVEISELTVTMEIMKAQIIEETDPLADDTVCERTICEDEQTIPVTENTLCERTICEDQRTSPAHAGAVCEEIVCEDQHTNPVPEETVCENTICKGEITIAVPEDTISAGPMCEDHHTAPVHEENVYERIICGDKHTVSVEEEMATVWDDEHSVIVPEHIGCDKVLVLAPNTLIEEGSVTLNADISTASNSLKSVEENVAQNNQSLDLKNTVGSSEVNVIASSVDELRGSEQEAGDSQMWDLPLSAIKVIEDGRMFVEIPTEAGQRMVPVPHLPPGTSRILVVATRVVESPGDYVYHVYTISSLSHE